MSAMSVLYNFSLNPKGV